MKNDFYGQIVDFMLKKIPLTIYNNFISAVRQDSRLTSFDEEIFDYYYQVIEYYIKTEKIYDDNKDKIKSKAVRKLLSGLISVLKSRISIFEETIMKYEKLNLVGENINPVYVEKRNLVELAKMDIRDKLLKVSEKLSDKLRKESTDIENTQYLVEFYNTVVLAEIIKLNDVVVKFYTELANDVERRTAVSDFYELLKDEAEVLGSVIKVQANELERTNQTSDEENVIQMILLQLRESYQYVISHVDSIANKFNSVQSSGSFIYHCDMNKFNIEINELENWLSENKNIDEDNIRQIFKDATKLSENIVSAFNKILNADKNAEDTENCSNIKDIINGIDETVKIKIESIQDGLNNLYEIYENGNITVEKAENEIIKFYKQILLFELTTFEEIMNYSVSKLRNSENAKVKNYVSVIDKEIENIADFLSEQGIENINPQPKDIFNGKEHDVLMAEKAEGFNKGEIIKVMTSGYKKDNIVYIRASVIAAK